MSACVGKGCTHPGCKGQSMQAGIHWPYCIDRNCTGCMPELPSLPPTPQLDLSLFRKDR